MRIKATSVVLATILLATSVSAADGRGGFMGFIGGCCFGIRAGAAYNDGKEIHWREWVRLIPYLNYVFFIWDGIDCGGGRTTDQLADLYGDRYY